MSGGTSVSRKSSTSLALLGGAAVLAITGYALYSQASLRRRRRRRRRRCSSSLREPTSVTTTTTTTTDRGHQTMIVDVDDDIIDDIDAWLKIPSPRVPYDHTALVTERCHAAIIVPALQRQITVIDAQIATLHPRQQHCPFAPQWVDAQSEFIALITEQLRLYRAHSDATATLQQLDDDDESA